MVTPVKSKCRAKNEETCPYHGTQNKSVQNFDAGLEKHLEAKTAEAKVMSARNAVTNAMESSLTYQGEKPQWWTKYETDSANNRNSPSSVVLMDVIDSPVGKLAVAWEEESQSKQDSYSLLDSGMGLYVCRYKSFDTGEDVGYLKLAYMNDSTVKRSFGDDEFMAYRWQDRYSGNDYGFSFNKEMKKLNEGEMTEENRILIRRKLWVSVQKAEGKGLFDENKKYIARYNISEKHLPDDETVTADLKVFTEEFTKSIKDQRKYYATPYVDYSNVNDELKGKGFGAGMYVYAARKLGERGQVLRGSGTQTPAAQTLWVKFAKNFPINAATMQLTSHGRKSVAPILDFRNKK